MTGPSSQWSLRRDEGLLVLHDAPRTAPLDQGHAFTGVTTGRVHSCGVTPSGEAYCWGGDTAGQLGDGTPDFGTSTPGAVGNP